MLCRLSPSVGSADCASSSQASLGLLRRLRLASRRSRTHEQQSSEPRSPRKTQLSSACQLARWHARAGAKQASVSSADSRLSVSERGRTREQQSSEPRSPLRPQTVLPPQRQFFFSLARSNAQAVVKRASVSSSVADCRRARLDTRTAAKRDSVSSAQTRPAGHCGTPASLPLLVFLPSSRPKPFYL